MTRNKTYPMLALAALLALAVIWKKGGRTTRYVITVGVLLLVSLVAAYWYVPLAVVLVLAAVWIKRQRTTSRLLATRERCRYGRVRRERMRKPARLCARVSDDIPL